VTSTAELSQLKISAEPAANGGSAAWSLGLGHCRIPAGSGKEAVGRRASTRYITHIFVTIGYDAVSMQRAERARRQVALEHCTTSAVSAADVWAAACLTGVGGRRRSGLSMARCSNGLHSSPPPPPIPRSTLRTGGVLVRRIMIRLSGLPEPCCPISDVVFWAACCVRVAVRWPMEDLVGKTVHVEAPRCLI
jgi:hypothetical protein